MIFANVACATFSWKLFVFISLAEMFSWFRSVPMFDCPLSLFCVSVKLCQLKRTRKISLCAGFHAKSLKKNLVRKKRIEIYFFQIHLRTNYIINLIGVPLHIWNWLKILLLIYWNSFWTKIIFTLMLYRNYISSHFYQVIISTTVYVL